MNNQQSTQVPSELFKDWSTVRKASLGHGVVFGESSPDFPAKGYLHMLEAVSRFLKLDANSLGFVDAARLEIVPNRNFFGH